MLPFILALGCSVLKLQSTTLETVVVHLRKKLFAKGQAYVALSIVKSLDGVTNNELDPNKLLQQPHDLRGDQEMLRLRNLYRITDGSRDHTMGN